MMRFPFDKNALESHPQGLQLALFRSATRTRRLSTDSERSAQQFGRSLLDSLLTGAIRSRYDESLANIGEVSFRRGEFTQALALYRDSLGRLQDLGDRELLLNAIDALARVLAALAPADRLVQLFAAEMAQRELLKLPLARSFQQHYAESRASLEAALGPERFIPS